MGCTRKFYRNQADKEVDCILTEKNVYDPWRIDGSYYLPPDPRARFADPSSPDRPPMPPDDPAAKNLSPNPQKPGKAGIGSFEGTGFLELMASWDAANRANQPPEDPNETPATPGMTGPPIKRTEPLDKGLESKERPFLLTLDQTVELALFNSREFQDQRENLYLSALAVTLQRFAFTYQFFATEELIREYSGRERPEGLGNRWRSNPTAGVTKLFPTGALLLFRFANQLVLNMVGGSEPRVIAPSDISLDVVQPLLRGGGRAVTLEPLTQTERNLVYSIRGFARFRKEFFVAVAGGGEFGNDFAPGSPLPPSGNAPTQGYLPTLLISYQLENEKQNVAALESTLALYRALQEGGDVSQLQVDQVELDLLNSRANVLQFTQLLRDALDRFKQQLGVPVSVPIKLDDRELEPLKQQQQRFLAIVNQFEEVRNIVNRTEWAQEPELIRQRLRQRIGEAELLKNTKFRMTFPERWAAVEVLTNEQIETRKKERTAELDKLRNQKAQTLVTSIPPSPELLAQLDAVERDLELLEFEQSLRRFLSKPWEIPGIDEKRKAAIAANAFRAAASNFVVCLGEARNERLAQVRQNWPILPEIRLGELNLIDADLDQAIAAASQTALANRFDLMNARAQVVDAWRQITVTANALFGVLNVRYRLDSFTPPLGTQPFDFSGSRSRHALVLNGELPLVRQAERNDYRTALLGYQRSRRILQQAEDQILTNVRSELRQLRFLAENYKIQQRAVELAYYQVESSLNVLQAPPRVQQGGAGGAGGGGGGSDSGSQAALTQQLLNAFSRLLRAQNQLYGVYQNYLVTRYQLFRDLELMTFDRRGVWIDVDNVEPEQQPENGPRPERLPPPRALPDLPGP